MQSGTTHVLLVEDEDAHAELIQLSFESQPNLHLTVVRTLEQARQSVARATPDLAIIDSLLPDGPGIEFAADLAAPSQCPVILLTSQADQAMEQRALEAGVARYVVKSELTLIEMPDIVEDTLRVWRAHRPSASP